MQYTSTRTFHVFDVQRRPKGHLSRLIQTHSTKAYQRHQITSQIGTRFGHLKSSFCLGFRGPRPRTGPRAPWTGSRTPNCGKMKPPRQIFEDITSSIDDRFSVVSLGLDSDMLLVKTSLFKGMPHTYVQEDGWMLKDDKGWTLDGC